MNSREDELKQIFLAEAFEHFEALNKLFTQLEKDHQNKHCVEAIFRITHTLKANAAAMGFGPIADLSHVLEDIFSEIKGKRMEMTPDLFNDLFRANDKLGELIHAIRDGGEVRYKGMLVKLKVILSKSRGEEQVPQAAKDHIAEQEQLAAPTPALDELNQVLAQHNHEKQAANELTAEELEEKDGELQQKIAFSDLVQVPVGKLDQLLNLVGELAIEKDRIITQSKMGNLSTNEYARLYRITSDLQYSVMSIRLVQVNVLFHKFHRIIRDVANLEGKKVDLELDGTDIEIDRSILQIISDSLIHLVRNAVSHGIEKPDKRKEIGKPEVGKLRLSARNNKDHVIIEVSDDGKGIDAAVIRSKVVEKGLLTAPLAQKLTDEEIIKYIFEPGFSSVEKVTEISGRGVGMDVVKNRSMPSGVKSRSEPCSAKAPRSASRCPLRWRSKVPCSSNWSKPNMPSRCRLPKQSFLVTKKKSIKWETDWFPVIYKKIFLLFSCAICLRSATSKTCTPPICCTDLSTRHPTAPSSI